jgi:PGF-CTERM protein
MSSRVVLAVVLLVVTSVGAGVAGADTPSLSLTVDGEQASGGQEFVLNRNPDLGIEASAAEQIESVVVRIDGESVRTFSPDGTEFSQVFVAQLDDNEQNTVNVIVRDSAGGVESRQITITKDGVGPFVGFESPFQSKLGSRPPSQASETNSRLTFAGSFEEITGVETISIERRHFYTTLNEERVATSNQQLTDPGSSFSMDVFLGYGRNEVTITMTDRLQNSRTYTIDFRINDRSAPELSVDETPTEIRNSSVRLSGTATDNVQIDEVTYSIERSVDSATLVVSEGDGADPARQSTDFEQRVPLVPGENVIRVTARDISGRTSTVRRTVVYNDTVVPEMSVASAVAESGSVRFDGFVRYGSFKRVSVETVDPETGETLDFKAVYQGETTGGNVSFDEQMAAVEDGPTEVVVRAVDSEGEEHVRSVTVEPGSQVDTASASNEESDGATESDGDAESESDDANGGSGGGDSASNGDDGGDNAGEVTSTPTVIPGFGPGHALVAVVSAALLLARRRNR